MNRAAVLLLALMVVVLLLVMACGGEATKPPDRYTLEVVAGPNYSGGGVVVEPSPDADGKYSSGTVVKLTAGPSIRHKCLGNPYWSFAGWSGDAQGSTPTVEIIMDSDKSVTAGFSEFFPRPCETPAAEECQEPTLEIGVNGDLLQFDKDRLETTAGAEVALCFNNVSGINQHNWVLVRAGTKDAVVDRGIDYSDNGWLQPGDPDIVTHVPLLKPGQQAQVSFAAPSAGTYQFVCTFPGHNGAGMFGDFVVTP